MNNQEKAKMLDWLLDRLHLIDVGFDAAYCEDYQVPSASFRYIRVLEPCRDPNERGLRGRPWNIKGESKGRLVEAIKKEMEKR